MLFGAIAGYLGAIYDNALMRVMDVLLAFPSLILAIAINSALLQVAEDSFFSRVSTSCSEPLVLRTSAC